MRIGISYWLLALSVTAYLTLDVVRGANNLATIVFIEAFFVMVAAYVVRWADAYEPEPMEWFIWAVIFGSGISIGIAQLGYSLDTNQQLNTFWAALLEEVSKVVVLILPFRKRMINSWMDGFVYGSLAGLGFSFSEDLLYAMNSDDGVGLVLYRDLNSVLAHSMFAGILGALMIAGIQQKRIVLSWLALPAGGAIHATWNTLVGSNLSESTLILALMTPAIYLATAFVLRDIERRQIFNLVHDAVSNGELAEIDSRRLWDLRQRKLDRKLVPSHQRAMFDRQISVTLEKLM